MNLRMEDHALLSKFTALVIIIGGKENQIKVARIVDMTAVLALYLVFIFINKVASQFSFLESSKLSIKSIM